MSSITVLMPIEVPEGDYCWNTTEDYCICTNYDNEFGHSCKFNLNDWREFKFDKKGVLKPTKCKELKLDASKTINKNSGN